MCDFIFIHAQKHIETCDQNILQSHSENSRCKPFSVHLPVCAYRIIMKLSGNGTWRLSMPVIYDILVFSEVNTHSVFEM